MTILDLPNEILVDIFEKLNTIDVLYSLVDVNQRFDELIFGFLRIHDLKIFNMVTINSFYNHNYSIDPKVIARLSDGILFRISDEIRQLAIEKHSMKQILGCCSYPQLDSLTLVNCEDESLYQDLQNDLNVRDILAKQIKSLDIDIKTTKQENSKTVSQIFALILCLCEKLSVLNYCDIFQRKCVTSLFIDLPSTAYKSSSLVKLQMNVSTFVDCLFVLDGRFQSLETLIIDVGQIFETAIDLTSTTKVSKLKCFSLTCSRSTCEYDTLIVGLLRRMINLKELRLYLHVVRCNSPYIDGIQLYDQFLISMDQLKKFTFRICTVLLNDDVPIDLQSNEDIQRSFIDKRYEQVGSYISKECNRRSECHVYSIPYDFEYFFDLDNGFPGGIFTKVRYLTMHDIMPFKQQIIQLICKCFPLIEYLSISGYDPLEDKQFSSTLVQFCYLTCLDMSAAHIDYAEEFLLKKNAHLPCLLNLRIQYASLTKITNNFTMNSTYFNFERLKSLDVCQSFVRPQNFHKYFPLL